MVDGRQFHPSLNFGLWTIENGKRTIPRSFRRKDMVKRRGEDGIPTDTQVETKNRSPHQGASDHDLKSRRRHDGEEVAETTVSFHDLYSWNQNQSRKNHNESPDPTYQPKYRWVSHHTQITHPSITRMRWASARPRGNGRPTDTEADTQSVVYYGKADALFFFEI